MTIALKIIKGTIGSIERSQSELSSDDRPRIANCLKDINSALEECVAGFQKTKEVPYQGLAKFLDSCKTMKQILGERMDKTTTNELRSALLHAQMFDKDLSVSLEQFKPKLLKTFLLGAPINWLFGGKKIIAKLETAIQDMKALSESL